MKSAYSQATPLRKENVFGPSVIGQNLVALLLTVLDGGDNAGLLELLLEDDDGWAPSAEAVRNLAAAALFRDHR